MSKVICYTRSCVPKEYDEKNWYFEMFSRPKMEQKNVGCVGLQLFRDLRRAHVKPTEDAPFTMKQNIPYMPWDSTVVEFLAELNGMNQSEIEKIMNQNAISIEGSCIDKLI